MWSLIFQAKSKVNKLRKDLLSVQQKRSRYVFVKNLETVKGEKKNLIVFFFLILYKQDLFVKSFSRWQLVLWKYKIKTFWKLVWYKLSLHCLCTALISKSDSKCLSPNLPLSYISLYIYRISAKLESKKSACKLQQNNERQKV